MINEYPPTALQIPFSAGLALPPLAMMRQTFPQDSLEAPAEALGKQMRVFLAQKNDLTGKHIAITVGSRGIPHLQELVQAMGEALKAAGARPFVVPCMGSHGGATAKGQAAVLSEYGVTEVSVGMPIRSSMDVVNYGEVDGLQLWCDAIAAEADGIVVFNKIRPHTMFHGDFESGIAKMMAVGLGKHRGATFFHELGFSRFAEYLPKVESRFLARFPVLCGVGVMQNEFDEIFHVEVIPPEQLAQREPELLQIARDRMARFPLPEVDLLILDEVGKNISGSGFDPNIFARHGDPLHHSHTSTRFQRMYIRSLTPESHNMGTGAFFADFASRKMVNSVDWSATWTNCVTCNLSAGRGIPIYLNSDQEALQATLQTLSPRKPEELKILWAKNSLELSHFAVSRPLYDEMMAQKLAEPCGPFIAPEYDGEGYLHSIYAGSAD